METIGKDWGDMQHLSTISQELDFYNTEECLIYLMNSYGVELKRLAYTYVKDWGKAEDLTQEVFVTCYEKLHTFQGNSAIKTWLYRITINKCKDVLRKKNVLDYFSLQELSQIFSKNEPSLHDQTSLDHDRLSLSEKVMSLPIKYREPIILFYYSELKIDEISQLTGLNTQTVKTRLRRAKDKLKVMFEGSES
jgi:RNA polymerase sigma-70 factor (ECF subfamily)